MTTYQERLEHFALELAKARRSAQSLGSAVSDTSDFLHAVKLAKAMLDRIDSICAERQKSTEQEPCKIPTIKLKPWTGGACPCPGKPVVVKLRDSYFRIRKDASQADWRHATDPRTCDIIAYAEIKLEEP